MGIGNVGVSEGREESVCRINNVARLSSSMGSMLCMKRGGCLACMVQNDYKVLPLSNLTEVGGNIEQKMLWKCSLFLGML